MQVRTPDIQPEKGPLVWSRVPEFAMTYNAYSTIIPYVEYYLNGIINTIRKEHCRNRPDLSQQLSLFVQQEIHHAQYHVRFNERMFKENIPGLKELVDTTVEDLRVQRQTRSIAFNAAYCAGFESIATYAAQYLYERCDSLFEGADPHGANLLLWHVAEEFEHRAVCHDAFDAVSGNYFMRMAGLLYSFWHVGGTFLQAEKLLQEHYLRGVSDPERNASLRRSRSLFWRQLFYVAPRMLKIFVPGYNPAKLPLPSRIEAALLSFGAPGEMTRRVDFELARTN